MTHWSEWVNSFNTFHTRMNTENRVLHRISFTSDLSTPFSNYKQTKSNETRRV